MTNLFSFVKSLFVAPENRDSSIHRNPNDRKSAETKASSSQSHLTQIKSSSNGWTTQETLELFGHELTEFEKIELGNYSRVYTIGKVRREN